MRLGFCADLNVLLRCFLLFSGDYVLAHHSYRSARQAWVGLVQILKSIDCKEEVMGLGS